MVTALDRIAERAAPKLPTPGRVGQATAVEQSRAVAEVHAAIVVAQQCPRSIPAALAAMQESCKQPTLAERAFYRFPRAGKPVTGPSVHLARELARCFGNVQYGVSEMRRDDDAAQSEMQAWAWDVQTNTRSSLVFIVPHVRDKKGGPERLVDMRDIYENNANNGARRVREAIFSILPTWFTEAAKDICTQTLTSGGDKPLGQRVVETIALYDAVGVSIGQLEEKLGRKSGEWTAHDAAQLGVIYRAVDRGETTREQEFPPKRVTADEIIGKAAQPASADPADDDPDRPADRRQQKRLFALFGELGYPGDDRVARLAAANTLLPDLGRPGELESFNDLTWAEADALAAQLQDCIDSDDNDPQGALNALLDGPARDDTAGDGAG
jgi:hypothetical protein